MITKKIKIHFLLEGNEEESLFNIINKFGIGENIDVSYHNCNGGGRMPAIYQYELQSGNYDIIYCVYDVDYSNEDKNSMFSKIQKGLLRTLGNKDDVNKISLCTNPNILLILLCGYTNDINELKDISKNKSKNTDLIKKYCSLSFNKKEYDASKWQLELIEYDYFYTNVASYDKIINKLETLNNNYLGKEIGSNIILVLKAIKENNVSFFEKIISEVNK